MALIAIRAMPIFMTGGAMFRPWVLILPVFVVRWLALRYCERFDYYYEGRVKRTFVAARPDVFFKAPRD